MNYEDRKGDKKCVVYGLAFRNTASSEFWEMIGGKILEKSNTREGTAEKGVRRLSDIRERRKDQVLSKWIRRSI